MLFDQINDAQTQMYQNIGVYFTMTITNFVRVGGNRNANNVKMS